ncbi:MAG: T9SS type A sorting domain-containing protein [Bacteroidales bacterium]|nr:T9SS type A sorting domain-containing protein [Bacteroidales bacterium]
MKKQLFTFLLVMLSVVTFGQQWVAIKSDAPSTIKTELVASSESRITVNLQVAGFYAFEVTTPRGTANIISVPRTVSTVEAGEPNLPMIAIPAMIGDRQHYGIRVVNAQYTDYQMEVAPSKGDFSRQIDPATVPYTYGEAYETDAFFPAEKVGLYEPYILRDFRGQNMVVHPFAYNPISKTLRVYHDMTVEMYADGQQGENVFDRRSNTVKMDPEFGQVYRNHFINYSEGMSKYTPVDETGELLIICHDAFMSAMEPFVAWKKQIGRPTTMVGTSTSGFTSEALKAYIQTAYANNPNISHILLVGDNAQIQGYYAYNGGYSGRSDNWFGQLAGNDFYNEVIVGRFSAETAEQVTTQVNKVIHYERDIDATDTWLTNGCGVSTTEGGGGHFGEDDYQHINNIRTDLMNYGYSTVYQEYYNTPGYNSTTQQISDRVNSGVSIINYCNHGTYTAWQSHSPYYSSTYVNALTNDNKLPIIFSVACLVGKYDHNSPCFAEAWMRATNNTTGNPTGAIGGMFSYISQPWVPPMYGQDEMVDVLVETYNNNIKRTLGGISHDGNMKILDQYSTSNSSAMGTYMTWILYGDPTLTIRNAVPANMNVTHNATMGTNATSFTVNATNGNGALATLTRNGEIMGSATINNGSANITFTAPATTGTATLTVFGYNKITYVATIQITSGGTQSYTVNVSANPTDGGTVTGGGTYNQGQSCTVSATANNGYTFVNWKEGNTVVSTNANYTFNVTGNRTLVANFEAQPQSYTISVSATPTNGGTVTGGGTYTQGQSCTVTATANNGYTFVNWKEGSTVVSTNANYTFNVTGNRILVANFEAQPQSYSVSVSANPAEGGTVEGGGTYTEGQSCTVSATANEGYTFVNWKEGNDVVSTNANYTFTVNGNRTLVANFQMQSYTITVTANPADGGTVSGGGNFNYGQSCTVTATANEGYVFNHWLENGNVVSTQANYTFTVTGNRDLVAIITPHVYTIFAVPNPPEGGNTTGEGSYDYGQTCTLTATPATGYNFVRWTKNGTQVSTNPSYTFTVTESAAFEAHFEAQSFTITATADPTEGGTVTGGGTYNYNASCTLRATPATGYVFVKWTKDGTEVGTSPRYTFTVTESAAFVAHFEEFDCEAPTNVTANAFSFTDIFVNWDAVPTAHAYDIYRNGTRIAFDYPYVGEYYDTGLPYGEYCYTIVAKCSLGDSDPSEEACATLNIPCNSPANFTAEYVYENESDFGVKLRWNSVAPISPEYFHLYRQRDTDEYELIGDIEPEGSYNYYFDDTEIGSYSYMLTAEYHFDGQICVSEPVYASCEVTSITELNVAAKVYPNPTKDEVTVSCEGLSRIRIVNAYGQTVYNAAHEGNHARIDLSGMAKGVYVMHVGTENGNAVRQIVVE